MIDVFGNVTNNGTTAWVSEPNRRGTWSILSSCIITISLCVWTAVHLNIPEHQKTRKQLWRKVKWLALGLLAPEIVAYVAWHQRKEAEKILNHVRKHAGHAPSRSRLRHIASACFSALTCLARTEAEKTPDSPPSETFQHEGPGWTIVHGFYVIMGGFAMDSSTSEEPFLPDGRTRVALTPDGVRFLLAHEPNSLPDISEEQIQDKSKADSITKTLVCAQASWFCVQCILRLAQSLPISLLELNTFGHSLCTLLIYLLWWHKPLNVNQPTLIQDEKMRPLFAYMWMTSRVSGDEYNTLDIAGGAKDEFDGIWPYRDPKLSDMNFVRTTDLSSTCRSDPPDQVLQENHRIGSVKPPEDNPPSIDLEYDRNFRRLSSSRFRYRILHWLASQKFLSAVLRLPAGATTRDTAIDHFSPTDISRWRLALQAIEQYDLEHDLRSRHELHPYGQKERDLKPRVKPRIDNVIYTLARNELCFGLAAAGSLYGGLHLVAWNAPFSSRPEEIMWRIAASSVTFTGLLFGPFVLWSQLPAAKRGLAGLTNTRAEGQRIRQRKEGRVKVWIEIALAGVVFLLMFTVMPLLWLAYVFSRVYLVVECFKNVAHLPAGAYQIPQWSSYVPHIT